MKTITFYRRRARAGFTLIELLIVITIIAALAALTASATMRVIGVSQERATEAAIQKTASVFDKQWKEATAKIEKETPIDAIWTRVLAAAGNDAHLARIIYLKLRLKQEFPMSFGEIRSPQPPWLTPLPTYVTAVGASGSPGPTQENSVCLLLALAQARGGITFNTDELGAASLNDSGFNGLRMIVDAWGNPVVFCRWPVQNPEIAGTATSPGLNPVRGRGQSTQRTTQDTYCDPEDPKGLLLSPSWFGSSARPTFENVWCHPISPNPMAAPGQRKAFYTQPVIWSAGPDKKYGMGAAPDAAHLLHMNFTTPADANDNIYSYRLRLGGS